MCGVPNTETVDVYGDVDLMCVCMVMLPTLRLLMCVCVVMLLTQRLLMCVYGDVADTDTGDVYHCR